MIVLELIVVFCLVGVGAKHKCPKNNPADDLAFSKKPAGEDYVRVGHMKEVFCCIMGFRNMTWIKFVDHREIKFPWYVEDETVKMAEDNQVLRFYEARINKDGGKYKCVANNETDQIEHVVKLEVIECEEQDGRIDITLKPDGPVIAKIGQKIEITCEGNFGCVTAGDTFDRIAQWVYINKDGRMVTPRNSSKYTVTYYKNMNGTIKGSKLTILHVEPEDYSITYKCILQTLKVGSRTGFNVTVEPPSTSYELYWIAVIPAFMLIVTLLLVIYWLNRPRVDLFLRRKFGSFPERGEEYENDILVLYSDKNARFAKEKIINELKVNYKVFNQDTIPFGAMENRELQENIARSHTIIVIYSLDFINDPKMRANFGIVQELVPPKVVVVKIEETRVENAPDVHDVILKNADKALTTIKWPWKDEKNSRKMKNFYCSLKNNLPKMTEIPVRNLETQNSISSGRPLLSSASDENALDSECNELSKNTISLPRDTKRLVSNKSSDSGIHSPSSHSSTDHPSTSFSPINFQYNQPNPHISEHVVEICA